MQIDMGWRRYYAARAWINPLLGVAVEDEEARTSPGGLEWTLREAEKQGSRARKAYRRLRRLINV